MDHLQDLLIANLIESLRQLQNYLVLAITAALSAFALAFRSGRPAEPEVPVPFLSLPLTRSAAHLVLWGITMIGGFMAGFSADRACVIAAKLRPVSGLLDAVSTFPSFATSHMLALRFFPIFVPLALSIVAAWRQMRRENAPMSAKGLMVSFVLAVYLALFLQMLRMARLIGTP
jgi:hypothetical protein